VLAVPPWHWVEHRNRSTAGPACLFHLGDEPALRALGLWHEEVGA
jgi:gentisate 1,2-dioxygenase